MVKKKKKSSSSLFSSKYARTRSSLPASNCFVSLLFWAPPPPTARLACSLFDSSYRKAPRHRRQHQRYDKARRRQGGFLYAYTITTKLAFLSRVNYSGFSLPLSTGIFKCTFLTPGVVSSIGATEFFDNRCLVNYTVAVIDGSFFGKKSYLSEAVKTHEFGVYGYWFNMTLWESVTMNQLNQQ